MEDDRHVSKIVSKRKNVVHGSFDNQAWNIQHKVTIMYSES